MLLFIKQTFRMKVLQNSSCPSIENSTQTKIPVLSRCVQKQTFWLKTTALATGDTTNTHKPKFQ